MNILFVMPAYIPAYRYGGPVKSVHELARKLVESGADITVYTTDADGALRSKVPFDQEVIQDGVKIHYFPVGKPASYFYSPLLRSALKDRIAQFDLVHINWLYVYTTMVAARECIRQGVPYVLSPRGMLDPNAIGMHGTLKKRLYLNLVEKKHVVTASAVHFTAAGERDQALSSGWRMLPAVVPNGLTLKDYDRAAPADVILSKHPELSGKKVVLFLGRMNYIKGLDLLAQAWPLVVSKVPEAHLLLAGPDDGYEATVRRLVADTGAERSTTFTGMLLGEEKLAALSLADVFVASSYLESFGMAIVEAMACGKPVVITDRVNICSDVQKAGAGVVTPCLPDRIADALVSVLSSPGDAAEMGRRGRRLVEEKFTWDIAGREMLKLYEQIIGKDNNGGVQ